VLAHEKNAPIVFESNTKLGVSSIIRPFRRFGISKFSLRDRRPGGKYGEKRSRFRIRRIHGSCIPEAMKTGKSGPLYKVTALPGTKFRPFLANTTSK
tara:strand:- start:878 stop:1168 length:291 start_codon:yes stop_codon:yes gene_type:complete